MKSSIIFLAEAIFSGVSSSRDFLVGAVLVADFAIVEHPDHLR